MALFKVKKTGVVTDICDPKTLKRVREDPLAYEEVVDPIKPADPVKPDAKKPEK